MPVRGESVPASHCSARSKSAGRRQLIQRGIAFDGGDLHASGAEHSGLVGRGWTRPAVISGVQALEPEGLRRLHSDQTIAVDGIAKDAVAARKRVPDGENGSGAIVEFEARDQPVDNG